MEICRLIEKKRDGQSLTQKEIEYFVRAVASSVNLRNNCENVIAADKFQVGAMMMAMYLKGLDNIETRALTRSMAESGHMFQWKSEWEDKIVGKHSTGGVGDKVSIVLAPALAACGLKVPKISGRSLGLTGGTLDKLESIPHFRVECSKKQIKTCLEEVGCCIVSQSAEIVPADKVMYKCRDMTATVNCLPLITASVLSKKIAEGLSALVIDVKCGKGALMKTEQDARRLAEMLVDVAWNNGIKTSVFITEMDCPLGKMIGNSLEVIEAVECLQGKGNNDLQELVSEIGGELLRLTGQEDTRSSGAKRIKQVLSDGSAIGKFRKMLSFQGVDPETIDKLCSLHCDPRDILPRSCHVTTVKYEGKEGYVRNICAESLAMVWKEEACENENKINYGVGLELMVAVGDFIKSGDAWVKVHHDKTCLSENQANLLQKALQVQAKKGARLVKEVVTSSRQ